MDTHQFVALVTVSTLSAFEDVLHYQKMSVLLPSTADEPDAPPVEHHVFMHPAGWHFCEHCGLYRSNVVHGCPHMLDDTTGP